FVLAHVADLRAADELTPPPINQPQSFKTFGRPIGIQFEGKLEVEPKPPTVRLDSSLTLTIRITYKGPRGEAPQQPPRAPILGEDFTSAFTVGDVVEEHTRLSWHYTYSLTPLSEKVERIPSVLFTYYSPLGYRTLELTGIDMKVLPRENMHATDVDSGA